MKTLILTALAALAIVIGALSRTRPATILRPVGVMPEVVVRAAGPQFVIDEVVVRAEQHPVTIGTLPQRTAAN